VAHAGLKGKNNPEPKVLKLYNGNAETVFLRSSGQTKSLTPYKHNFKICSFFIASYFGGILIAFSSH